MSSETEGVRPIRWYGRICHGTADYKEFGVIHESPHFSGDHVVHSLIASFFWRFMNRHIFLVIM